MKGYQTSCFVCVCNLREWELLGAISIKAWLCCSMQEPAITLPLLLTKRRKAFETRCCVISVQGVTSGELSKVFQAELVRAALGWPGWVWSAGCWVLAALDPGAARWPGGVLSWHHCILTILSHLCFFIMQLNGKQRHRSM